MPPAFKKKVTSLVVAISLFLPVLSPFSARTAFAHPAGPGNFPLGHHLVHFGALIFLFLDGIFFRPGPRGYVVAPAPVGAVVPVLPSSAVLVTVEGVPYYDCSGVYYRQIPEGYVVVTRPAAKAEIEGTVKGLRLQVQVPLLNVRSGPGPDFAIVGQVGENTMLDVEAFQSDWSKVKLPDGSSGWVQNRYTRVIPSGAQG
jgi:hypothetical protein